MQIPHGIAQITTNRAANAAILQQHRRFGQLARQKMVKTNRADFIDQHSSVGKSRLGEQIAQNRRLATAEEAGEDVHRRAPVSPVRRVGQ